MLIKIISVPEGEAPPEIREAWVGLILPVSRGTGILPSGAFMRKGVESGQFAPPEKGFAVMSSDAIQVLKLTGKTNAASYWTDHDARVPTHELIFRRPECQPIGPLPLSEVQFQIERTVLESQSKEVPTDLIIRANHILDRWLRAHGYVQMGHLKAESEVLITFWGLLSAYGLELSQDKKQEIVDSHNND